MQARTWQDADTYIVERTPTNMAVCGYVAVCGHISSREDTHIAVYGHGWHAAQRACGHTYGREVTHIGRQYATYVYTRVRVRTNIAVCRHGWHAVQRGRHEPVCGHTYSRQDTHTEVRYVRYTWVANKRRQRKCRFVAAAVFRVVITLAGHICQHTSAYVSIRQHT
jgi:hypothetical protein